jgi:cell division protease FtsH
MDSIMVLNNFIILLSFSFLYNSCFYNILLDGFITNNKLVLLENNIYRKNYNPFSKKYYDDHLKRKNNNDSIDLINNPIIRRYPLSGKYMEEKLRRLNSKNITEQSQMILGLGEEPLNFHNESENRPRLRIILNKSNFLSTLGIQLENDEPSEKNGYFDEDEETGRRRFYETPKTNSKNFQVIQKCNILFKDVGGYENVKEELKQCIDILKNYQNYLQYNVRIPKGLILEGPPGTGKTLLSKALAGEANCSFIPVSGSDFQEKYVGVGSTRIKELFELAKNNIPCIIFIDEIDALGRKRSSDGESSSSERDNTLNALLVELDGFKNNSGIFLVSATNRIDLLDSALIRPGRIDKKIYIGLPDSTTREAIIRIHIAGKPYDESIIIKDMVEITEGFSGAQIENLLNEAMLNALRYNKKKFAFSDFDLVLNKMMVGWQPMDHQFNSNIIDHIAIHEMGHAVVGLFSKHHSKVSKVVINLSSPKSPGYTVFEGSTSNIYIREALFEHLMILLAGRIAEELFYDVSVTTGAINDFEEALKLAEKMIIYYGMGKNIIYPSLSEKYKELIDTEVVNLINDAYKCAQVIIQNSREFIEETSEILKREKILKADMLNNLIDTKYHYLKNLKIEFE